MKYRDHIGVICSLLEAGLDGARRTKLVYRSNTNFEIVRPYITELIKTNMFTSDGKFYQTTEKGISFMKKYEELQGMLVC